MSKPSEAKPKPPSWVDVRDAVKYNEETLDVTLNGKFICQWNDEANCDYPEDLTWSRTIGGIVSASVKAGAEFNQQFEAKRSARLLDALEKLTMTEENRNRLDQVDSDTLQRLLIHMSIVATEAIREYRETE